MVINSFIAATVPGGIYLIKVGNGNTGIMCEIFSKLAIKTTERRHRCRSVVFIVNFAGGFIVEVNVI